MRDQGGVEPRAVQVLLPPAILDVLEAETLSNPSSH
jgi:hypothetical protein